MATSSSSKTTPRVKARGTARRKSEAVLEEEAHLPLKPIVRPPSRARANARQNLATALTDRFGHSAASATAIARAVVDPSRVRQQLGATINERVPGGTLHMVHTEVWPAAICPSPINPRAAGDRVYPAGASVDRRVARPRRPLVVAGSDMKGAPSLHLKVEDPDHFVSSLQASMDVLMSTAEQLILDLPEQGVMRPVTVVALRVEHDDRSPTVTLPTTPDGSSRTTIVWDRWGLESAAEAYNVVDDRRLGQKIAKVEQLASKDATLLTDDERVLLRLSTVPAEIIVGFTADPGSDLTFARAVESWVADIHVDPPRPWGMSADLDTKATAILESFAAQTSWSDEYIDYLGGYLTPTEAKAAGFGATADVRALEILVQLGDDTRKTILNDGLRRLGARRPRRPDRLEPLVELMLRPLRGSATPAEIGIARTTLLNLRDMAEWNRPGWTPSGKELEDLVRAAKRELSAALKKKEGYEDTPTPGPLALELGFMGAFWLARHGGLRRQTRGAIEGDDREPAHLFREMMTTEYGLTLLKHIIKEGRAGHQPQAVDASGKVAKDSTGAVIPITTPWIKSAFPRSRTRPPKPDAPDYARAVKNVRAQVNEVESAVKHLMGLRGASGGSVARSLGLKPSVVDELKRKLGWASDQFTILADAWTARHADDEDAEEAGANA